MKKHSLPEYIEIVARVSELLSRQMDDDIEPSTSTNRSTGEITTVFGPDSEVTIGLDHTGQIINAAVQGEPNEAMYVVIGYFMYLGIQVAID